MVGALWLTCSGRRIANLTVDKPLKNDKIGCDCDCSSSGVVHRFSRYKNRQVQNCVYPSRVPFVSCL